MSILENIFPEMNTMKDKYFLDTNIFVYTFDNSASQKQKIAQELVKHALDKKMGVISFQVIQEFLNVATKKFTSPLSCEEAKLYLDTVLKPLCEVFVDFDLYQSALDIKKVAHFSFYDSLILSAALKSECKILYSEDLNNGQLITGLKIKNPFVQ